MSNWVEIQNKLINLDGFARIRCVHYKECNGYDIELNYIGSDDTITIRFDTEKEMMDCYNKCKDICYNCR